MQEWLIIALRPPMLLRGIRVSLVVGTILIAINQGDQLLVNGVTGEMLWKIPLTYAVPFCVSVYAGTSAAFAQRKESDSNNHH